MRRLYRFATAQTRIERAMFATLTGTCCFLAVCLVALVAAWSTILR